MILAVVAVAMMSCNKVEKILPKKDGIWKVTQMTQTDYKNGTQTSTETQTDSLPTYTFNKDGSGSYTDGVDSGTFEWSVNSDNDKITLTEQGFGITMDVVESKKKTQKWQWNVESTVADTTFKTETVMDLERQ